MDRSLIDKWVNEGTINKKQAAKMLADIEAKRADTSSSNIITAVSVIGAILIGAAAILFIALNWRSIPSLVKMLILLASTAVAMYAGYALAYGKQNLPRVGKSLLFLGALLWGATVFLTAQIYNVNANAHMLVLIWLLGVLPLVYTLASRPLAVLAGLLFYLWFTLYVFRNMEPWRSPFVYIPLLYIASGTLMIVIGGFHYLSGRLKDIGRIYRLLGIKVALLMLFIMTFRWFLGEVGYYGFEAARAGPIAISFIGMATLSIIGVVIHWFINPAKLETTNYESPALLIVVGFALLVFGIPPRAEYPYTDNSLLLLYTVLANLLFAGCCALLLYLGYTRRDMTLVNTGMFWAAALIIARYCNIFWDALNPWLFFLIGGAILLIGGIALEKKRRALRTQIGHA